MSKKIEYEYDPWDTHAPIRMIVKEPKYKYVCRAWNYDGELQVTGKFMTKKAVVAFYNEQCTKHHECEWLPIKYDPQNGA